MSGPWSEGEITQRIRQHEGELAQVEEKLATNLERAQGDEGDVTLADETVDALQGVEDNPRLVDEAKRLEHDAEKRLRGDLQHARDAALRARWLRNEIARLRATLDACEHVRGERLRLARTIQVFTEALEHVNPRGELRDQRKQTVELGKQLVAKLPGVGHAESQGADVVEIVNQITSFMSDVADIAQHTGGLNDVMATYGHLLKPFMPLLPAGARWAA